MSNKTQKSVDPKEKVVKPTSAPTEADQKVETPSEEQKPELPEEDIEGNPIDNPETPADESQDEDTGEDEFLDEFDDDDDSVETLEADKDLKDRAANGEIAGLKPQDASVLQSSMVPHPISGKPVYATAEQAMLAETYKNK